MTPADIIVLVGGFGLIIFIIWFFFGKRGRVQVAEVSREKQQLTIVIEGAYSPSEVEVKRGVPVTLTFDRREEGDCSEWVIFGKLKVKPFGFAQGESEKLKVEEREIKAHLAPHAKTKVEFTPMEEGEFPFSCGMGMLHGKLIVKE